MRASIAIWLLSACGVCWAPRAQAAELRVDASASCAAEATIRLQAEQLIGRTLDDVGGIDFELSLHDDGAGRYRLRLRTVRAGKEPRERELSAASCQEASDAAAVALAMAVAERERAAAEGELGDEAGATARKGVDEAASAGDPSRTPLLLALGASALVESGALPELAAGAQLGAALGYGLLRIEAAFALFAEQATTLPDGMRGGDFGFLFGALLGCAEPPLGRLRAFACAGLELGVISARGRGILHQRDGSSVWRAARADAALGVRLIGDLSVLGRLGLALPLARDEFLLDMRETVHRPDALSLRGLLGLELELSP